VRYYVIPEIFFQSFAEQGKLYVRLWSYWLSKFADEIYEPDFIEKQIKAYPKVGEIKEIYEVGIQLLQQNDFKIVEGKKKKKETVVSKENYLLASKIIEYLNHQANTSFSIDTGTNKELIISRIKEGYSISEFKVVIDNKVKDWKGTDWERYLRPLTLFSKSKFENYLNANIEQPTAKTNFTKFADSVSKAKALIGILPD